MINYIVATIFVATIANLFHDDFKYIVSNMSYFFININFDEIIEIESFIKHSAISLTSVRSVLSLFLKQRIFHSRKETNHSSIKIDIEYPENLSYEENEAGEIVIGLRYSRIDAPTPTYFRFDFTKLFTVRFDRCVRVHSTPLQRGKEQYRFVSSCTISPRPKPRCLRLAFIGFIGS